MASLPGTSNLTSKSSKWRKKPAGSGKPQLSLWGSAYHCPQTGQVSAYVAPVFILPPPATWYMIFYYQGQNLTLTFPREFWMCPFSLLKHFQWFSSTLWWKFKMLTWAFRPYGIQPHLSSLLILPCTLHLNSNKRAWMCAQSFYFHVLVLAVCSLSWQNGLLPILPGLACMLPPPWGPGTNHCSLHELYRWHMLWWQQLSHPASHHGHLCQHGICPHSLSIMVACADLLWHLVAKHYIGQKLNWMEMCNIMYAMNSSSQELTLVWRSQNKSWSWRVSKNIMRVSGTHSRPNKYVFQKMVWW